ncbi:thiamine phosphate synthase [Salinicoccus sp. ID82-1]|uniref:thiamine phosphate synthase n=1 Tax=Salinicoccus sp. ID82-1 TaxID=2820269 RepID=UPI001F017338|nr:thiamine phosphate synthase [Salinicoccus sp. ID82-1]
MMKLKREDLRLYFICGSSNVEGDTLKVIEEALESGVTMFQLREKGQDALEGKALVNFAETIRSLCRKYNVPFIVNDDARLAERVGADGIHLGKDDQTVTSLSPYFDDKIIGLSVRDRYELDRSELSAVDYIGTGPVFPTHSKDDAGSTIGVEGLAEMRSRIKELPMVAIGGINTENFRSCLRNGADGVSFISAIAEAEDVGQAVRGFLK